MALQDYWPCLVGGAAIAILVVGSILLVVCFERGKRDRLGDIRAKWRVIGFKPQAGKWPAFLSPRPAKAVAG